MVSNRIIKIDLNKKTRNVVQMVQGDTNRKLTIKVYDSDEPYLVDGVGGETIHGAVYIEKPDGTTCGYDSLEDDSPAVTGSGNTLTVYFVPQATTAHGWAYMTVSIFDDEGVELNTFGIDLFIDKKATAEISADYWNLKSIEGLTAAVEGLSQQMVRSVNHATADSNGNVTLLPWQLQYSNVIGGQQVGDVEEALDALARGSSGLTAEIKSALLNCFAHVAWADEHGQDYYDALDNALNPPAQLSFISAVFSQGSAVIYDTDSLDTLRQYLTVTAHYSDSTTQIVTTYTLSGTLTEGISTITVSYGGKMATFTVTVTAETFPNTYQQVEWVGATITGNSDKESYIDVGISVTEKIGMSGYDIIYSALSEGSYVSNQGASAPVLSWSSNSACWFGVVTITPGTNIVYGFSNNAGEYLDGTAVPVGARQNFHTYWDNTSGITECGQYSCRRDYIQGSANLSLRFGTGLWANSGGTFKFFGDIQVRKDGILVRDLFPCYRKADGVIGFYDTVNDVFYTKQGSGAAFEKGSDI